MYHEIFLTCNWFQCKDHIRCISDTSFPFFYYTRSWSIFKTPIVLNLLVSLPVRSITIRRFLELAYWKETKILHCIQYGEFEALSLVRLLKSVKIVKVVISLIFYICVPNIKFLTIRDLFCTLLYSIQYYTGEPCRPSGFPVRTQFGLGCSQPGSNPSLPQKYLTIIRT